MLNRVGKITRNGNTFNLVIPRDFLAALNWHHGDHISVHVERGMFIARSLQGSVDENARAVAEAVSATVFPR